MFFRFINHNRYRILNIYQFSADTFDSKQGMTMLRFMRSTILILSILCSGNVLAQQADEPVSRTFPIRYKTIQEFQPLVQALLSNRGIIETSADLNMIVVRDLPLNLSQIDSLLTRFDRPTQQFMIEIHLLLGSNDPLPPSTPDSIRIHELLDPLFSFSKYEELDRAYIRTEENILTVSDIAGRQFNITFQVDYIEGSAAPVRFRQFILSETVRDISGQFLRTVYASSVEVEENVKQVFAAIKQQQTGKTLVIAVSARRI